MNPAELTGLINAWQDGDNDALNELLPLVYDELHRLARGQMRNESGSHTLQATALVNEAFIRLAEIEISYQDRSHFLAMASRTMRRVLVDHARSKKSAKRGGGAKHLVLDERTMMATRDSYAILDLDNALTKLSAVDKRLADGAELVIFGGLSYAEAAVALGVSKTTINDDIRLAKAWMLAYMGKDVNE